MAHYQLSYGFNSSENTVSVNNVSTNLGTKNSEIQNVANTSISGSHNPNEKSLHKSEAEKRKLPQQPSEPG